MAARWGKGRWCARGQRGMSAVCQRLSVVRLFGWPADEQSRDTLLGCPGHNLLPACHRPELIRSATAGMESNHPLSLVDPVVRQKLRRCTLAPLESRYTWWAGIVWLAHKARDRLEEMVSNMDACRRMWPPREHFP